MLEEPDSPLKWDDSLQRIAVLQARNSSQPAHLKSSYPVETQVGSKRTLWRTFHMIN